MKELTFGFQLATNSQEITENMKQLKNSDKTEVALSEALKDDEIVDLMKSIVIIHNELSILNTQSRISSKNQNLYNKSTINNLFFLSF